LRDRPVIGQLNAVPFRARDVVGNVFAKIALVSFIVVGGHRVEIGGPVDGTPVDVRGICRRSEDLILPLVGGVDVDVVTGDIRFRVSVPGELDEVISGLCPESG
jgi:hypothetical protein